MVFSHTKSTEMQQMYKYIAESTERNLSTG